MYKLNICETKIFLLNLQDCSDHPEDDVDLAGLGRSPLPGLQLDDGLPGGRLLAPVGRVRHDRHREPPLQRRRRSAQYQENLEEKILSRDYIEMMITVHELKYI